MTEQQINFFAGAFCTLTSLCIFNFIWLNIIRDLFPRKRHYTVDDLYKIIRSRKFMSDAYFKVNHNIGFLSEQEKQKFIADTYNSINSFIQELEYKQQDPEWFKKVKDANIK